MKKGSLLFLLCLFVVQLQAQSSKSFKVEVSGTGQPVILIPGYSCSGEVWKETVEHLKSRYQCHVLTLAGYAGVPAIGAPILQTIKNDIIAYVKEHQLQKPILVGHSLGAFMSIWVNSDAPGVFGKMICVDGLPFLSALNNPAADADSLKVDPRFNTEAVVKSFESLPDSGFIDRTAKAMLYQVNDSARARQIAGWQYNSNRRTLGLTLVELSTTDLRPALLKIAEPILVLGSVYGTKENSYKLIGAQYANAKDAIIHIADSKHFIMYDQPQWLYNEIDAFLKP